jgi:hypothetical protein
MQQFLNAYAMEVAAAREQAVEMALQDGTCGVLEVQHSDGSFTFTIDPSVPYGHIYVWDDLMGHAG